jgi:amino acid transporter
MMVMPMDLIYQHPSDMLAVMADTLGGSVFRTILCVDAVIVLCGGVLTAIVGVSSLLCRLANDNVLPSILKRRNGRKAPYVAIIVFVSLSMSLFLAIFDPKDPTAIDNFGGVFAIAFLSVLTAFAVSTILLKLHRSRLARRMIARWWEIFLSFTAVFSGLIGNIVLTPQVFTFFLVYLSGYLAVVIYMFARVEVLSFGIWMVGVL